EGAKQPDLKEVRESLAAGRRLLREGSIRSARQVLQATRERGSRDPELLQLHRQADLLADLLQLPLEAIVQQAQRFKREEEWKKQFTDYRGKAVVFDDTIRRDRDGEH